MTHYIDKAAVVAELEKLISNGKFKCQQSQENNDQESYIAWSEHIATCGKILSFLNTLKVKEVDLEKELDSMITPELKFHKAFPSLFDVAKHFFELGLRYKSSYIGTPNIDDTLKEMGVNPDSKEANTFKESYFRVLDELQAKQSQKGEEV